ncbi:hypothetical protein H7X65_03625 [Candidatus Parcubacteria bacterium]|nr:hypothetical protein [Candidatus Parcubacteria bacterium]
MSEKYNIPEENSLDSMEGIKSDHEEENGKEIKEVVSREQIQEVMDMVVDIKKSSYAYHSINGDGHDFNKQLKNLSRILKFGLLGSFGGRTESADDVEDDEIKRRFIDKFKNKPAEIRVFANIIGRDIWPKKEMGYNDDWQGGEIESHWHNPISLLFDISDREEIIPGDTGNSVSGEVHPVIQKSEGVKLNQMWAKLGDSLSRGSIFSKEEAGVLFGDGIFKHYGNNVNFEDFKKQVYSHENQLRQTIDFEELKGKLENAKGFEDVFRNPDTDDGFVVGKRIAPRKFRGIICRVPSYESFEENSPEDREKVSEIVRALGDSGSKTGYLPIYDQEGNLWWPERISHVDIIKMKEEDAREGLI